MSFFPINKCIAFENMDPIDPEENEKHWIKNSFYNYNLISLFH